MLFINSLLPKIWQRKPAWILKKFPTFEASQCFASRLEERFFEPRAKTTSQQVLSTSLINVIPINGGFKCLKIDVECRLFPVHSNLRASWVLVFGFLCCGGGGVWFLVGIFCLVGVLFLVGFFCVCFFVDICARTELWMGFLACGFLFGWFWS